MTKNDLLRQVRDSMTHFEPLTEENIRKVAEEGLTPETIRAAFAEASLGAGKIIVDLEMSTSWQESFYGQIRGRKT